jgi:xylulose-5-phosphate/fructose-6-phosphate phosphoketolase
MTGSMEDDVTVVDRWWRTANYLVVAQMHLLDNPLPAEPLLPGHVRPEPRGHWSTAPGLTFCWAHVSRTAARHGTPALVVAGPVHAGAAVRAAAWLEGTLGARDHGLRRDGDGLRALVRGYGSPTGVRVTTSAATPGVLHPTDTPGQALAHAQGAADDNPGLVVACVVGDGEAESDPSDAAWQAGALSDPATDGAVLPLLHLDGSRIEGAPPGLLARLPAEDLRSLLRGRGHAPLEVTVDPGADVVDAHRQMAAVLDEAWDRITDARARAARGAAVVRDGRPVVVLRSPPGWTGPPAGDTVPAGRAPSGTPLPRARTDPEQRAALQEWLRSYRPEELFDDRGAPRVAPVPAAAGRCVPPPSACPQADGGALVRPLELPTVRTHQRPVPVPGVTVAGATRMLGGWVREVLAANPDRFRVVAPGGVADARLGGALDDDRPDGAGPPERHRVLGVASARVCQGRLEGYVLSGRHGLAVLPEEQVREVDAMLDGYASVLAEIDTVPWRRSPAALTVLVADGSGEPGRDGHAGPVSGLADHIVGDGPRGARLFLPPDGNTLLCVIRRCLGPGSGLNVVVSGTAPGPQWLDPDAAAAHVRRGGGVWEWAGTVDPGALPDVVLAGCGAATTVEVVAAASLLREHLPGLAVRVVDIVEPGRLATPAQRPEGWPACDHDALFPPGVPVALAFHGRPALIHHLLARRPGRELWHVAGRGRRGGPATPFGVLARDGLDRFRLAVDALDRVPGLAVRRTGLRQRLLDLRAVCLAHADETGEDAPLVRDWSWPG